MERLIRRKHIRSVSLHNIESPFFAVPSIRSALSCPTQLWGLIDLIEECGATANDYLFFQDRILEKVERGDWLLVSSNPFSPLSDDYLGRYKDLTHPSFSGFTRQQAPRQSPTPITDPLTLPQPAEPGFYIIQKPISLSTLESLLFEQPSEAALAKFRSLNPHFSDYAKPGQMAILGDPRNTQCIREEALLMEAAARVNAALDPMSDEEAKFLVRYRDEIEMFLTSGSGALGIGEAMFGKYLQNLQETLKQLENLHQNTWQQHGKLQSPEFFSERKRLLRQLDGSLTSLVRKGVGMPDHPKLKAALGISSRSLVHHWSKAGTAKGIPGYATHIDDVAKAAKYIHIGGWIRIGLSAGSSAIVVQKACSEGREGQCRQVSITEAGKFSGGLTGGAFGGAIGTTLCVGLGVTTGIGGLACGVVMAGAGSAAGGYFGGKGGEAIGEAIYEITK
ncbi:hypothetical protein [Pseudomonas lopnurensis]|uniref:hypothetical protein n=1 Tax=Pseudomonas lopnurensis TaxID=1477517 RepID=UPI001879C0C6|nr:hypothetical protein [Pseudomonas lopnurensis]MBE7373814.1 hypothetical protein [Pseudomonas lopnurensis]